jgi:hypothetical protein
MKSSDLLICLQKLQVPSLKCQLCLIILHTCCTLDYRLAMQVAVKLVYCLIVLQEVVHQVLGHSSLTNYHEAPF